MFSVVTAMAHNRVIQWATFSRTWWIYDANFQCPFKSAKLISWYLQGMHKPIYHAFSDVGDHVVVMNAGNIAMKGDFWRKWMYHHHTKYAGGYSRTSAWRKHEQEPTWVLRNAIYSTIPGNLLRQQMMRKLHLYPDENVPDDVLKNVTNQIRQVQMMPKSFADYTQEEKDSFPCLFDWPIDHVIKEGSKQQKGIEPEGCK